MYSYFMLVGRCIEVEETLFGKTLTLEFDYKKIGNTQQVKVKFDKLAFDENKNLFDTPELRKLKGKLIGVKGAILSDGLWGEKLIIFDKSSDDNQEL